MTIERRRVWEHRFAFLTHAASISEVRKADLRVFAYLLAKYSVDDDCCWPKLSTMVEELHMGKSQVQRSIRQLIDLDLIALVAKEGPGKYVYRPTFESVTLPERQRSVTL